MHFQLAAASLLAGLVNAQGIPAIFSFSRAGAGPIGTERPVLSFRGSTPSYPLSAKPITYAKGNKQNDPGWNGWAYVMNGNVKVGVIYYHNNDLPAELNARVTNFLRNISQHSWFSAVKKYYNKGYNGNNPPRQYVQGLQLTSADYFHCSWGWTNKNFQGCKSSLAGPDAQNIISQVVFNKGYFPNTPEGDDKTVYIVILGNTISESVDNINRLGDSICGYHSTFQASNGKWLKYAVVKSNTSGPCRFFTNSRIGDTNNVLIALAHELVETITSPNPANQYVTSGWKDADERESMSKCGSSIARVQSDASGKVWNHVLNGDYLLLPSVYDPETQACSTNGLFTLRGTSSQGEACADASDPNALKSAVCNNDENSFQALRLEYGQLKVGNSCLEAESNSLGAKLRRVACDWNRPLQFFKYFDQDIDNSADGAIHLAGNYGLCLDIYGWGLGNSIVAWNCNGQNNQKWRFRHFN